MLIVRHPAVATESQNLGLCVHACLRRHTQSHGSEHGVKFSAPHAFIPTPAGLLLSFDVVDSEP